MSAAAFTADLTAYLLQTSLLLAVGLLLPALFRLRDARVSLAYWQALLVAVLLLPLLQPEPRKAAFAQEMEVTGAWLGRLAEIGESGPSIFPRLLLAVVAAGILVRLTWLGIGLRALRSYRRGARPIELASEVAHAVDLAGAEARLLVSGQVENPVTFGWHDPVVLLPAGFPALPFQAQRGILCHELLHVRRRDWLCAMFEEGVRAALWFHPGIWLLLARIGLCREQVVDRETVRLTGSRRAYLEALRVAAFGPWRAVPGLPFFHRGHLRERVAHLCKEVPMSRPRTAALVTTFAGLLAVTAVLGILAFPMAGMAWAGGKPLKVGGDVKPPKILHQVPPTYPKSARDNAIEGIVIVTTVIDEQGKVQSPAVEKSSGDNDLDQAALDAVSQWTFKPATLNGKVVSVYYTLTIRFTLDDE
jgi:TonB family protein